MPSVFSTGCSSIYDEKFLSFEKQLRAKKNYLIIYFQLRIWRIITVLGKEFSMQNFFNGFKAFVLRGNVVDMAVGVIIGGAFGKIVSSLVNDIIMPPIGKMIGGIDFSNLFIILGDGTATTLAEAEAQKLPVIAYGRFLTNTLDFLIMAFVIFCFISLLNKLKRNEPAPKEYLCPFCRQSVAKEATRCPHCTSEMTPV